MPRRVRAAWIPAGAALAGALALVGADPPPAGETWRFDRLDSIGGHATTVLGHPQIVDTSIGKALSFDGVQDAVQLDVHPLAGAQTFTMEMIFRPDPGGGEEQRFFHLQEVDPQTGRDTATRMLFELRVIDGRWCLDGVAFSGNESKVLIDREKLHSLGAWHHAALVYDGRELRDYVDGVEQGSAAVHLAPQGPGHSSIGTRIDRRSYFKGAVFLARMTPRALAPSEFLSVPHFREHTVATGLAGGYQVVAVDLNHDGKPDLIALTTRGNELVWFENPTWERHTLATGLAHMINCVAVGADSEGIPEIVLASEFDNVAKNSIGVVSVLHHDGDPRRPWKATEIDRLPTSHRLRLADIDGSGKPVVINAALTGPHAEPPDYRDQTPLVYYRPGIWKRETIQPENTGLVHGIYVLDWDGDGRDEILNAGFEGIHLFKLGKDGQWSRTAIAAGAPDPWPKSGSSDIAVGRIGQERFLAAIEPWHGNQVAIYRLRGGAWQRQVIDTSLVDGHTLQTADLDGDGDDEVIAGYRGGGHSVYLYHYDRGAGTWSRQMLDQGGMGAAACAVVDLNGDGRPDIACIGSATANLKWYENLGPHP
ncbi:MAG: FG-GAP-like repeat-containing protein [Bryobacteraceae bacterium]